MMRRNKFAAQNLNPSSKQPSQSSSSVSSLSLTSSRRNSSHEPPTNVSRTSSICLRPLMSAIVLTTLVLSCIDVIPSSSSIFVSARQSGIYVDNGREQTIMHHLLDEMETLSASYDILEFLGLPERPRRKHNHLSLR